VQSSPADVLAFWFGREGEPGYGEFRSQWFRKDEAFDREVADRFGDLYERAAAGELDAWREEAESCLALVIVLDQFPRNMFRGDARTHATDGKALDAAKYAIERALDRELPAFRGCSSTCRSCTPRASRTSAARWSSSRGWRPSPGGPTWWSTRSGTGTSWRGSGAFPHRNAILGRETTPEEAEFLTQPGSSF
jgi:uncharacterized protein (DUF924 family)